MRVIATLLAVVLSATPFAFVLCGVNCAHAAKAVNEGHACHETEETSAPGTSSIRGVPPACTHFDTDEESVSRVEATFTMSLPLGLIPPRIESLALVAQPVASVNEAIGVPAGKTRALQLRV